MSVLTHSGISKSPSPLSGQSHLPYQPTPGILSPGCSLAFKVSALGTWVAVTWASNS